MKRAIAFSPSTGMKMTKQRVNEKMSKLSLFSSDDKENIPVYGNGVFESQEEVPKHPLAGLVIEVEGNLASGKSTLLKKIRGQLNKQTDDDEFCTVFSELINDDFLKAFYGAPKEYGFAFQMYMLTTRLYQIEESYRQAKTEGKTAFLDRGAVGDTLFALLSTELGNMSQKDMDIYRSVCRQRMPATLSDKVDVLMYLDVDPNECHRRVTTVRNTEAEEGLPLAYLNSVDKCYFHLLMDWIADRRGGYHEMNIGKPPQMLVCRWNNFGKTEQALNMLEEIVQNKRRSPTVEFMDSPPENNTHTTYSTAQQIESMFTTIKKNDQTEQTETKSQEKDTESRVLRDVETIVFDWALEHKNEYRRVVMYYLSLGCHVIFYNNDLK